MQRQVEKETIINTLTNRSQVKKKKSVFTSSMITKWKLFSPLSPFEEKIVGASLCVFVCFTFYQIVWVFSLPFQYESWEMRLATPCLVSSFDNFTFQSIKKFIFLSIFFILYVLYSIYLFYIQYCYDIVFYEEIVFLNKYYKNKPRILYHKKKKIKKSFLSKIFIKICFLLSSIPGKFLVHTINLKKHDVMGVLENEFRRRNFL